MKSLAQLSLLLLFTGCGGTAPRAEPDPPPTAVIESGAEVDRPPEVALTRDLADRLFRVAAADPAPADRLRELTRIAPQRVAGSADFEAAEYWAQNAMVEIGLQDVRREPVVVSCWDRGAPERATLRVSGVDRPLPVFAMTGSVPTPRGGTSGVVLRLTSLEDLREKVAQIPGRIVFFDVQLQAGARDAHLGYAAVRDEIENGASYAAAFGASAVVVRSPAQRFDDVVRAVQVHYLDPSNKIPAVTVSPRMAAALTVACAADPQTSLTLHLSCSRQPIMKLAGNVIGEIPGQHRPEEVVLLAARLDGQAAGEGAHANGAGVAHCLAAARLLLQAGIRADRTVRVVLFVDGLDVGTGMRSYAADHSDELALHVVSIGSHSGGFYPIGFEFSQPDASTVSSAREVRELVAALDDVGAARLTLGLPEPRLARMLEYGVPVMSLKTASSSYYDICHSALDTFASVTPRDIGIGSAMLAFVAGAFATPEIYK